MRTLKEQEYQLIALKYKSISAGKSFIMEMLVGIIVTYLLLQWNSYVAALVGAWICVGVFSCYKEWTKLAVMYVDFKLEMELMMLRGPNAPGFLGKLNRAVADGEKELDRMEKEMKDDDTTK